MTDDINGALNANTDVARIERLTHDVKRIREDQHAMRAAIEKMSDAVTRLALVEERQYVASTAIDRLASELEKLDERLRRLEITEPLQSMSSKWIMNAVWAAAGVTIMFIAAKVGLI